MTSGHTAPPLVDALYELSLAEGALDAARLDAIIARYPEHAEILTAFAVELAMDAHIQDSSEDGNYASMASTETSPAVSRAISRFQNRLHATKREQAGNARGSALGPGAANPFLALDRAAFRGLAERLHASTVFVAKLRDRQIDPATVTDGFRRRLSAELSAPLELVAAHFAAPQQPESWRQLYKAIDKPQVAAFQSFGDAVRNSGMDEEQQRYLLAL